MDWTAGASQTVVRLLSLWCWPWPLSPFRPPPFQVSGPVADVAGIVAAGLLLLIAGIAWRRSPANWRIAGSLALLPVAFAALMFDAVGPYPVADRHLYLSVAGVSLAVAFGLRHRPALLAALIAVAAVGSFVQTGVWRDEEAFVRHATTAAPQDPAVRVLAAGIALRHGGAVELQQAREHYAAALELSATRSDFFMWRQRAAALAGLAWCDYRDPACAEGADGEALLARFRAALAHDCDYVPALVGCGVACGLHGRHGDALAWFRSALTVDPSCPEAWFNLARTQLTVGSRDQAAASLQQALRIDPGLPEANALLASLR
jgi:tetratricopeptide (TPR) repeat protein